jgi:hypothetical protein
LGWHPLAVVQYTFTQKQYTEQYNETKYTEQNTHNNKNTQFTKLNRSIQNLQPCIEWYKIEPKDYERNSKLQMTCLSSNNDKTPCYKGISEQNMNK